MDNVEEFFAEIYNVCISRGMKPHLVANLLEDVVSMYVQGLNSISAMSSYVRKLKGEEETLMSSINKLNENIEFQLEKRRAAEELSEVALEANRVTQGRLDWFIELRDELEKHHIPVDNVSKFAKAVKGVSEAGYDESEVVNTYSEHHNLKVLCHGMQKHLDLL